MAAQSPTASEKLTSKRSSKPAPAEKERSDRSAESQVRVLRLERGFTQDELAEKTGMHRNSLGRIERQTTQEITPEKAEALARVLNVPVSRLGLRVRPDVEARSVRFRKLTLEQRYIVDEILSLPPAAYGRLREVIEALRPNPKKARARAVRK
jgi:transcriptional regulator with XRE-family HTH domain